MESVPHGARPASVLHLPASLAERARGGEIELRPFGTEPGDLDLELDRGERARRVTELLRRCAYSREGAVLDDDLLWSLPVGMRLHALVVLCQLAGWKKIIWSVRCPAAGCGEPIDLALPLDELARTAQAREGRDTVEVPWSGERVALRLPTGEDLRRWAALPPSDDEMLAALGDLPGESGELPPELAETAEAALAEADPLVDVQVQSACPGCGAALDLPVDLEGEALALLRQAQEDLFRQVRILAGAFHWSEREILELPARRRRRYLEMLAREEA